MARRSSSGPGYNPLADKDVQNTGLESWVCLADDNVHYHRTQSMVDKMTKFVGPGQVVSASKSGDWLEDKGAGLFLPFKDSAGNRLFKNERLSLMQRVASGEADIARTTSATSSRGSNPLDNLRRTLSGNSAVENIRRTLSGNSAANRTSFRWVDDHGISHRLAGDSELLSDLALRPEVWVCVKQGGVAYRHAPLLDAVNGSSLPCGEKVTAVKEDDWLKVFEVKNSVDIVSALEAVGRRSLRSASQLELHDTGMYLPFSQDGERLFKNEKLVLFEMSQNVDTTATKKPDEGCALM